MKKKKKVMKQCLQIMQRALILQKKYEKLKAKGIIKSIPEFEEFPMA
ncbi:MAG TPA: hypothetical protein PKK00_12820 [Bacteroidales bacterium]|nr:hypothetical protein [Bacteroidales bacterium]HPS18118.1 hypothetical protein [Bacteroidales bacterium]